MRKSNGKTVYLEVGIWFDESRNSIHIASPDVEGLHSTISGNPDSIRSHPNLFRKLANALRTAGVQAPKINDGDG